MMQLLAARLDRTGYILVNTRLDQYPAFFYIDPEAVDAGLGTPWSNAAEALAKLQTQWQQLAPELAKLVRRHGNDFVVTPEMLRHP